MAKKTKTMQPETPNEVQGRDNFQSPNYATELIIPFLSQNKFKYILEPCAGMGKMVKYLSKNGFLVDGKDINTEYSWPIESFLNNKSAKQYDAVVTNLPFSIKTKCIEKAIELNVPCAFLIPFDMSGFLAKVIDKYEFQCLIPNRRINYLTPFIVNNIYKSQLKRHIEKETGLKYKKYIDIPDFKIEQYKDDIYHYKDLDDVPIDVLAKHSSSDFHSFWLTRYFNLPDGRMTFCDLSIEQVKTNI